MKSHTFILAGLLLGSLSVGCATTGYKSAEKSALSMENTRAELNDATYQITATFKALDALMNAQVGDLRPLQANFSKEVNNYFKLAEATRPKAVAMREKSQAYFNTWANSINQITDPQLKQQSLLRREEAMKSYQQVEQELVVVRDAYWPLYNQLDNIKKALDLDLTPAGVAGVRNSYKKARQDAQGLQKLVQKTLVTIDGAQKNLAPIASAP